MGFYSGWSSGRGFYSGYRVRLPGGGRRSTTYRPSPLQANARRADDVPEWVELSYLLTATVVFGAGILSAAVWLWFSTDGYFDSLPGRLFLIVLLLIPAVIVSGVAAIAAGFAAPIVVGLVKAVVALVRWISRQRAARRAASPVPDGAVDLGE
ncbi:hypothetical protein ACFVZR_12660 [Streptomyces sp. NPDC058316]|uniref:hypothetical protein n=1 Tax=unclassified Streptomyces TaxID=2593676 RepID=UPI0036E669A4